MNRERLHRLEEAAGVLRLRLQHAQMHAARLRVELDRASRRLDEATAQRDGIEAGWRQSMADGQGLDLQSLSAWRALAAAAESRRRAAETTREDARKALLDFGRELARHESLSERGDAQVARERSSVLRKLEDKRSHAILERHTASGEHA